MSHDRPVRDPDGESADESGRLDEVDAERADGRPVRYDAPPLPPLLILAVVGLLCGFVMISLVWLSERGCERFRDTPNCGPAGFPLLVLTVVVTIVLGALALGRLAIPHPRLIAFLGVGFMLLIVLGFLAERLFSPWTLLIVPALTAATFFLADLVARLLERADA